MANSLWSLWTHLFEPPPPQQEGHGLVRAQHPGSARIEEFLTQLEVLWEELKRRHQRNAVFLRASKELGFRVGLITHDLLVGCCGL